MAQAPPPQYISSTYNSSNWSGSNTSNPNGYALLNQSNTFESQNNFRDGLDVVGGTYTDSLHVSTLADFTGATVTGLTVTGGTFNNPVFEGATTYLAASTIDFTNAAISHLNAGAATATTVTPGGDNSTKVATTAFAQSAIANMLVGNNSFTGSNTVPTPSPFSLNNGLIASTSFTQGAVAIERTRALAAEALLAPLASPAFTGSTVPTSAGTVSGGGSGSQLITKTYADMTYGSVAQVFPTATYTDTTTYTGTNRSFNIWSTGSSWSVNNYFTIRYTMFVEWTASGSSPFSYQNFASAIGTMNIYPNRAVDLWGVESFSAQNNCNINNYIYGSNSFDNVNNGVTNAGNPICPNGRPYFSSEMSIAGNNNPFFLSSDGTSHLGGGYVRFQIQNPSGFNSALPFQCSITVELVNAGAHSSFINTSGFTTNFSV